MKPSQRLSTICLAAASALLFGAARANAQSTDQTPAPAPASAPAAAPSSDAAQSAYSRLNSWTILSEGAPNSRHIILGQAEDRHFLVFAGEYARKLSSHNAFRIDYVAQLRPISLESDPTLRGFRSVATGEVISTFPQPQRVLLVTHESLMLVGVGPTPVASVPFYSRKWTYGGAIDPLGFRMTFREHRRLQPFLDGTSGFVVTTRDVPVNNTFPFNFEFSFGGGLDYYLTAHRSLRIRYGLRHMSNAYVAPDPGIDAGFFEVGFSFGH